MENLKVCKNCGIESWHYIKDWLQHKNEILICGICRIETPIEKEIKQIKLL